MKTPNITIGILNMNGYHYLKRTIPLILKFDYPNKEILVVDNGSIDKSISYLHRFPQIKIIQNKKNKGYGAGKNQIVENSKGDYILMLDNDILIKDKNILKLLLNFYSSKNGLAFVSIPLQEKDSKNIFHYGLFFSSIKKPLSLSKLMSKLYFEVGGFIGGCVFFRKKIFLDLGEFDLKYPFNLDDYDLSARASLMNYRSLIYTKSNISHLGILTRENSISWSWKNKYYLSGFSRMIIKNYSLLNLLFWLPISSLWIFYKSIKKSFEFKSLKPICSFFLSSYFLFKDLPDTLKQRKIIQSKRVVKEDIFLKIKPPKFK